MIDALGTSECPLKYVMVDSDLKLHSNLTMKSCFTYLVAIQDFTVLLSERNFFLNCNYSWYGLCEVRSVSQHAPCWESNPCLQCVIGLSPQIVYGETFFDL